MQEQLYHAVPENWKLGRLQGTGGGRGVLERALRRDGGESPR